MLQTCGSEGCQSAHRGVWGLECSKHGVWGLHFWQPLHFWCFGAVYLQTGSLLIVNLQNRGIWDSTKQHGTQGAETFKLWALCTAILSLGG